MVALKAGVDGGVGESCVACGATLGETRRLGAVDLATCDSCGTATALPRPSLAALACLHDSAEYFEHPYFETRRAATSATRLRCRSILALATRHRPSAVEPGRRLLDVGCDTGDLAIAASELAGLRPFGVDIAGRAVEIARGRGVEACQSDLANAPTVYNEFGLITAVDLIEHVSDPAAFFVEVRKRLASDGVAYVETPNLSSFVYSAGRALQRRAAKRCAGLLARLFPQEHVQYLTDGGLRALAGQSDLCVLESGTRKLPFKAVGGGVVLRAAVSALQLPDSERRQILQWALMGKESR